MFNILQNLAFNILIVVGFFQNLGRLNIPVAWYRAPIFSFIQVSQTRNHEKVISEIRLGKTWIILCNVSNLRLFERTLQTHKTLFHELTL